MIQKISSNQTVPFAAATLRFNRVGSKGRLVIDKDVVSSLLAYRQVSRNSTEAGGLLLGRHLLSCHHLAVDEISKPQPGDRRSRNGFYRGRGHHKTAIKRWKKSNHTCTYLGSWHTHPEHYPTPSPTDLRDWRNALRKDTFEGGFLYFIIVGQSEVACWEGTLTTLKISKIEQYKGEEEQ